MMTATLLGMIVLAVLGLLLCRWMASLSFLDHHAHPWRLLLVILAIPLVPLLLAMFVGLQGWTTLSALLVYLAGFVVCAFTVAERYAKRRRMG